MQTLGEQLAFFLFIVVLPAAIWQPITWLLLSIFTPKALLERYFKEPHFTLTETILMAQFPGFLMRTAIFAWLLIFPKLGKRKRQIRDVKVFMPCWYQVALVLLTIGTSFVMAVLIILLPTLLLFDL